MQPNDGESALNEDNIQKYIVVSIVTILLVISALSGWAVMNYLKQDETSDTFTIEGTYDDDNGTYGCTGTASYVDMQESSKEYVYLFTFIISYDDGQGNIYKTTLESTLDIIKDTDEPNEELFQFIGTTYHNDMTLCVWEAKDENNGHYTYYLYEKEIIVIDIDYDGFELEALNDDF